MTLEIRNGAQGARTDLPPLRVILGDRAREAAGDTWLFTHSITSIFRTSKKRLTDQVAAEAAHFAKAYGRASEPPDHSVEKGHKAAQRRWRASAFIFGSA
jgi:hypothetical protein